MSPGDARLVAALTVLRDQLAPVVDEIAFGELSSEDRRQLGRALRRVADALDSGLLPPSETGSGEPTDDVGADGSR